MYEGENEPNPAEINNQMVWYKPGPDNDLVLVPRQFGRTALMVLLLTVVSTTDGIGQDDGRVVERVRMVAEQIRSRGVHDSRVLDALRTVPRHRFLPDEFQDKAYADTPLPIGWDQTISQPYIVAYMTEALQIPAGGKVLEIGTGSGYQAAVLAEIAETVYTIEILPELAEKSRGVLGQLEYHNIHTRVGDGYRGWPEEAPFDAIIVTAAPDHVPPTLVKQLSVGARLVIPVGQSVQEIRIVTKTTDGSTSETTIPVRFVPMTGKAMTR